MMPTPPITDSGLRRRGVLLESIDDVVFRISPDGVWLFLSDAWATLSGFSPENTVGQPFLHSVHPHDREQHQLRFLEVLANRGLHSLSEARYLHVDGGWRWVEVHWRLERESEGRAPGVVGTLRDITTRTQPIPNGRRGILEVTALQELTRHLVRTDDEDEVYQHALRALEIVLERPRLAVLALESDGVCRFKAWRGLSEQYRALVEGHFPWAPHEEPQLIHLPDVEEASLSVGLRAALRAEGIANLAFVPLVHAHRAIGKVMLYGERARPLQPWELQFAQRVAEHVSSAVLRTTAFRRLVDEARRDAALRDLLSLALEPLSQDDFLARALDIVLTAPGLQNSPRGAIFLLEGQPPRLQLRASRNLPSEVQHTCALVELGQCLCGEVAQTGRMLVVDRVDHRHTNCVKCEPHGHIVAPISTGGPTLGVLEVCTYAGMMPGTRAQAFMDVMSRALAAIIERRRAVESLEHERRMFMGGPVMAFRWAFDSEWTIEYASPNVSQFGWSAERLMAERVSFATLIHPSDLARVAVEVKVHLESGVPFFQQTYRLLTSDDHGLRWVDDYTVVTRNEAGAVVGLRGYLVDVTEQRQVEQQREHLRADFQAMIEHSADPVFLLDEGRVWYANPAALRLLGAGPASGQPFTSLLAPEDRRLCEARQAAVLRQGKPSEPREYRFVSAASPDMTIEVVEMVHISGGQCGIAVVGRDVTERKQAVARAMQVDRLVVAGTLAAGVAHEINNPLAYVLANVSFATGELSRLQLDPEAAGRLAEVQSALRDALEGAQRVRDIVHDLKSVVRSEPDGVASADLAQVARAALSMARSQLALRAQVQQRVPDLPRVAGSQSRLTQVVLNLLINAAQAIPPGKPETNHIHLAGGIEGSRVWLEVSDTGQGISAQDLPRIFDPFFTTKAQRDGTGLGLFISHGIVKAVGGELTVQTTPGKGTTFRMTLPRSEASPVTDWRATPPHVQAAPPRLLVVDDDSLVLTSLSRLLSPRWRVTTARGAAPAMELFASGARFDVVLSDLMMPGVSGMELHQHVVRLDPAQARRWVLMTGGAFTPDAQAWVRDSSLKTLAKPFEEGQVEAVLLEASRS